MLADTVEGQIGVLPRHAPMLTILVPGTVRLRRGDEEEILAVGGGFLEVSENKVVVLADSAERAEEIDVARAEEARRARPRAAADEGHGPGPGPGPGGPGPLHLPPAGGRALPPPGAQPAAPRKGRSESGLSA